MRKSPMSLWEEAQRIGAGNSGVLGTRSMDRGKGARARWASSGGMQLEEGLVTAGPRAGSAP